MDTGGLLDPLPITFILGLISILLLYWSTVRHYNYWKERGVPSANAIPVLGSLYECFGKHLHDVENKRYKELGRVYGHFEGNKPGLCVAEPALLRDLFVRDFPTFHDRREFISGDKIIDKMMSVIQGDDWKRIRNIVTPTFSTGKIKRMMKIFKEGSTTLVQNFRTASESGKYIDAKRLYGAFTMDIIANSAFSTRLDSHNDPDNVFVRMASKAFNQNTWIFILFFLAPGLVRALKLPLFGRGTTEFFRDVTQQIVEERRKSGKPRNDFLQLLMDTAQKEDASDSKEKEDDVPSYEDDIETQIFKTVTSKHLSMDELVAQSVSFFLGGYETTASTLAFASYSLALHPEIQDTLRREVDGVLKETNGDITYEAIQSMKYLDKVISETLRMYPPLTRIERLANADYELGDTGITIPKGMIVSIPVYAMHRDPELYPDPETFDPERFSPEERGNRDQYTYLPFGSGPRNCVGMRFALMEIKMCLAHVVANFIIKKCPETKVPIEFAVGSAMLQPKNISLEMEIRRDFTCPMN